MKPKELKTRIRFTLTVDYDFAETVAQIAAIHGEGHAGLTDPEDVMEYAESMAREYMSCDALDAQDPMVSWHEPRLVVVEI
jgi:hypothetical protein